MKKYVKKSNSAIYSEDDLIMLSALQHYLFCPRQCALIHIECLWEESRLTAEGRIMHERKKDMKQELHVVLGSQAELRNQQTPNSLGLCSFIP